MAKGRNSLVMAAALLAPTPLFAQTAADPFCVELRAIVAAARETPAFASLGLEMDVPRAALGFDNCIVLELLEGHPAFGCVGEGPNSLERWRQLAADIRRCLPGASTAPPRPDTRHVPPINEAHFRAEGVWIWVYEQRLGFDGRRGLSLHIEPEPLE